MHFPYMIEQWPFCFKQQNPVLFLFFFSFFYSFKEEKYVFFSFAKKILRCGFVEIKAKWIWRGTFNYFSCKFSYKPNLTISGTHKKDPAFTYIHTSHIQPAIIFICRLTGTSQTPHDHSLTNKHQDLFLLMPWSSANTLPVLLNK